MESDHEAVPPKGVSDRLKIHAARVKQHLQDNKTTYLVGAGCLAAGYFLRRPSVTAVVNNVAPTIAPVISPVISPVIDIANNVGHCTKVVQDLETGHLWPKIGELARELATEHNIPLSTVRTSLSKHLNGHTAHVFGKQYRTIALGTTG